VKRIRQCDAYLPEKAFDAVNEDIDGQIMLSNI
ncbi:N-acetyltransferase, partial [Bacillus cereus group sp. N31]|nr:N-acetyltransferase [Bacillus cereus group sp. N31]